MIIQKIEKCQVLKNKILHFKYFSYNNEAFKALIAQMEERQAADLEAVGSNPAGRTIRKNKKKLDYKSNFFFCEISHKSFNAIFVSIFQTKFIGCKSLSGLLSVSIK